MTVSTDLLTKEESLVLYRKLVLARLAEEKIRTEYYKDEMKTPVHLGIGGEAISVGVCHALPSGAKTFGTYRNHSLYFATSEDTDGFFGEMYGKANGVAKGKAGSMHLFSPERNFIASSTVVGTTIPVAVGVAMANVYNKSNDVVAVFFGDGAVEEGVFWESMNFASLRKLPVLFICEDNGLAIHAPTKTLQGFLSIQKVAQIFDCYQEEGNGSDVLEVVEITRSALRQMAQKPKPAFLRFTYHRFLEHVGTQEDYDVGYRERPSKEVLKNMDPVLQFEKFLHQNGFNRWELNTIKEEMQLKIDQSVIAAQKAVFPNPEELHADVFTQ